MCDLQNSCWLSQALLSLQDNGSGAGSPPRGQADADYDSIYDADTAPSAPSAEDSAAGSDLQNEATQPRPAAGELPGVTLHAEMCCTGKKTMFLPCPAADAWIFGQHVALLALWSIGRLNPLCESRAVVCRFYLTSVQ